MGVGVNDHDVVKRLAGLRPGQERLAVAGWIRRWRLGEFEQPGEVASSYQSPLLIGQLRVIDE